MTGRRLTDGGTEGDRSERGVTCDVGTDERPSEAVVRAVATLTDTPPLDIDPLYDAVDPAHLDGVFGTDGTSTRTDGTSARTDGSLSFAFNGCRVTVTHDEIRVREIDGGDSG